MFWFYLIGIWVWTVSETIPLLILTARTHHFGADILSLDELEPLDRTPTAAQLFVFQEIFILCISKPESESLWSSASTWICFYTNIYALNIHTLNVKSMILLHYDIFIYTRKHSFATFIPLITINIYPIPYLCSFYFYYFFISLLAATRRRPPAPGFLFQFCGLHFNPSGLKSIQFKFSKTLYR